MRTLKKQATPHLRTLAEETLVLFFSDEEQLMRAARQLFFHERGSASQSDAAVWDALEDLERAEFARRAIALVSQSADPRAKLPAPSGERLSPDSSLRFISG